MTQRQTGRDDAMSGISNSLTGSASNCKGISLAKKKKRTLCGTLRGAETLWSDVNQEDPGLQCAQEVCNE